MGGLDEYAGSILQFNDMIELHPGPMIKVEAENVEAGVDRNVYKARRIENGLIQNEMRPDKAFLDLKKNGGNAILHPSIHKSCLLNLPFTLQSNSFSLSPVFSQLFLTSHLGGVELCHVGGKSGFCTGIPWNAR